MNYLEWHVGMQVVCIQECAKGAGYGDEVLPVCGKVYTIREVSACGLSGEIVVYLAEISNKTRFYTLPSGATVETEPAFAARQFRPVQRRKTDISIFTAMLCGQKQEERA